VTAGDHPPPQQEGVRLASDAPLARSALIASLVGVVLGFSFLPQVLGLALGGISLVREPHARRPAIIAVATALVLTVAWGIALGAVLKWWAASQT
jgi:hypothetical protein